MTKSGLLATTVAVSRVDPFGNPDIELKAGPSHVAFHVKLGPKETAPTVRFYMENHRAAMLVAQLQAILGMKS